MFSIIEIVDKIKKCLNTIEIDNIIMDSFILGKLQRENNENSFEKNLDSIVNLRQINQSMKETVSITKCYDEILCGSQNLEKISTLSKEQNVEEFLIIQEEPDIIQSLPDQRKKFMFNFQQRQFQVKNSHENRKDQQTNESKNDFKSIELALKIQQEFEQEYQNDLLALQLYENQFQDKQIIEEIQNQVECQICLEDIQFIELIALYCGHIFHKKCLNEYCQIQIQSKSVPMRCPWANCKENVMYSDLREVLDMRILNEFQQLTFTAYINNHSDEYSWCPTPDCTYIFIANNSQFYCPVCKKSYCLICKTEFHQGQTCQQYRASNYYGSRNQSKDLADQQFFNFLQGAKYKQCPQCKFWVEKNQGCDHMTCRCKFGFCYVCGGVYLQCACINRINMI
ncbi:unnamed protein product [Paramecium sonneborni]|uniref:Uncharacterized protein n=1 Tax=Paramecium sonneborni TaxID=65129 RepID=A0A8S1PMT9_9CILI|nr:unnamed protein product [Paramecium sonneborni]